MAVIMSKTNFTKWLKWLDEHALLIMVAFLTAFIPLYPKLPLFEVIPGYIVRVRLEDIFIVITAIIWATQVWRKKISWKTPLTPIIGAYAVVGLLSTISAVFISKTVPFELIHIGKSLLHYFRYLEYFSLFFAAYAAIKTKRDVKIYLFITTLTLLCVFIYGVGQRHFYWPVYSTMNREFSKGLRLYLTEHARVQSTFGGHYDMGAYLVVILPILAGLAFGAKKWLTKLGVWVVFAGGLWLLMLSAARTSLFALGVGIAILLVLGATLQSTVLKKSWWFVSRSLGIGLLTVFMMSQFGSSMYERLLQTLEAFPSLNKTYHDINRQRKDLLFVYLPTKVPLLARLYGFELKVEKPANSMGIDPVLVTSDERPVAEKPSDVYVDVPDYKQVATVSAEGVATISSVAVPRTYSDNAFLYGLSAAIRLDTLWPRALAGFYTNPLLGSGYATLAKETAMQFTEAESTDNNFLRTLGETGALGFVTFYGAVVISIWLSARYFKQHPTDRYTNFLILGFIAGSVGLLVNASYIDVFAASKVALIYWLTTGFILALVRMPQKNQAK